MIVDWVGSLTLMALLLPSTSFSYVLLRLNRRLQTESTAPKRTIFLYRGIARADSLIHSLLLGSKHLQFDLCIMDSLAQKSIFLSHKLCIIARNCESLVNFFKLFSGIGIPLIYTVERSVYCLVGRCVRRWVKRCICFLSPLFQIFQLSRRICNLILELDIYRIINSAVIICLSDLALYAFQPLELFCSGL